MLSGSMSFDETSPPVTLQDLNFFPIELILPGNYVVEVIRNPLYLASQK